MLVARTKAGSSTGCARSWKRTWRVARHCCDAGAACRWWVGSVRAADQHTSSTAAHLVEIGEHGRIVVPAGLRKRFEFLVGNLATIRRWGIICEGLPRQERRAYPRPCPLVHGTVLSVHRCSLAQDAFIITIYRSAYRITPRCCEASRSQHLVWDTPY